MHRCVAAFFISLIGFTTWAEQVVLSGTVSNKSGKPISNAVVTLVGKNMTVTTNDNGLYSIASNFAIKPVPILPSPEQISLRKGVVLISMTRSAPLGIEMFDVKGNLLEKSFNPSASAGDYRFDLMTHSLASNMMIIRVSMGKKTSAFRFLPFQNGKRATASCNTSPSADGRLAKIQAATDSLYAGASGYFGKVIPISSYIQHPLDFILDTLTLDPFSFFVTSLKVLRELSHSQRGFGGDLRFGKTGPGSGLSGADSICQCIAEKSMPGSKIKIWRAFLSAVKGLDGKQVNAIERIGHGPWYDRRGRLVAMTRYDLLQNRPVGIDLAIKNDLPNEDGLPNHQPDLSRPAVDNHMIITGSDSAGRLYSATSTCEDWTSAESSTTSMPRCGLSWIRKGLIEGATGKWKAGGIGGGAPVDTCWVWDSTGGWQQDKSGGWVWDSTGGWQQDTTCQFMMNMRNWISAMNAHGCLPGVDSVEWTAAGLRTDRTIGAGGGYGGFYCFGLNP